jgi:hypothetical protein
MKLAIVFSPLYSSAKHDLRDGNNKKQRADKKYL